ncbi:MAG: hypothetical protein U1E24_14745, partial [Phenylobacterium sp.]|nr:hypothetical protein [Phenylobacterium sp.]
MSTKPGGDQPAPGVDLLRACAADLTQGHDAPVLDRNISLIDRRAGAIGQRPAAHDEVICPFQFAASLAWTGLSPVLA